MIGILVGYVVRQGLDPHVGGINDFWAAGDSHERSIGAYFPKLIGKHCMVILGAATPPICNTSDQYWSDQKNRIGVIRRTEPNVKLINIGRFDWEGESQAVWFIWENSEILLKFFVRLSTKHFCSFAHVILPDRQSRVTKRDEIMRVINVESGRLPRINELQSYSKAELLFRNYNRIDLYYLRPDPWPIDGNEGSFSYFRRLISGLGGFIGDCDRRLRIAGLISPDFFHRFDRLPEPSRLSAEDNKLQKTNGRQNGSQLNHPPIGRRLVASFIGVFGGFWLSLFGWNLFDDGRRYFGGAIIWFGWLMGALGFWLLWILDFRWSWAWWI